MGSTEVQDMVDAEGEYELKHGIVRDEFDKCAPYVQGHNAPSRCAG